MAQGKTDSFTFKLYRRSDLVAYINNGSKVPVPAEPSPCVLPTNPISMSKQGPRLFTKQPTIIPGHFTVQDYGVDTPIFQVQCQVGNILKGMTQAQVEAYTGGAGMIGHYGSDLVASGALTLEILGTLNYYEILTLSQTFKMFVALDKLYNIFDADEDILTLEFGATAMRGILTAFNYEVTSDNPWNWKYDFAFLNMSVTNEFTLENYNADLVTFARTGNVSVRSLLEADST